MSLGSRYNVASGWNECRFVSWLIYTWPWQRKLFLFWMLNSFLFTFSEPCDRSTSKQIPMNCNPPGENHCLLFFFNVIYLFLHFPLSLCLSISLSIYLFIYLSRIWSLRGFTGRAWTGNKFSKRPCLPNAHGMWLRSGSPPPQARLVFREWALTEHCPWGHPWPWRQVLPAPSPVCTDTHLSLSSTTENPWSEAGLEPLAEFPWPFLWRVIPHQQTPQGVRLSSF